MNEIAALPARRGGKLAALQKAIADKKFDEAIKLAETGLAAAPDDADLWNALGVALRASGQAKTALGCYRRALDLRPNDLGVVSNWANALKDLGRYREAAAMHQRVVAK
jgi:cytochrome c-type biogenesis protein CcmH/NrfG